MDRPAAIEPPRATRHVAVLAGAALALCGAAVMQPGVRLPAFGLVSGATAALTVAHFAWRRRRRAERLVGSGERAARGRIVEQRVAGRVVFDLPADGIEPWGFDAWVLGVTTFGLALLAQSARPVMYVLLAFLIGAVAARLFAMRNDRIRLEFRVDGYLVDAVSANRPIHRFGPGPILPQLDADALTLWASSGRLGVLRNELTAPERAWLAERLARLVETRGSAAGEAHEEIDQKNARDDGQREQQEHAE